MGNCLIYQLGEHEVVKLENFNGAVRKFNTIFVCPNCFKSIHLGRCSEDKKWEYDDYDTIHPQHTMNSKTEKGFKIHVKKCKSVLGYGINRVDFKSPEKAHYIVDRLARFSKREAGWDTAQVYTGDFLIDDEVVAYVMVNEVGPVSYAAFRLKTLNFEGQITSLYFLWDLYTFPTFRKRGLATNLVERGIKDLIIDESNLPVSCPFTEKSVNIVKNVASDKIMPFMKGKIWRSIDKSDIEKYIPIK